MVKVVIYDRRIRVGEEYFKTDKEALEFVATSKAQHLRELQYILQDADEFEVYKEWCKMEGIKPCYATSLAKFKQESGIWNACN